jgi:hypothetical protein
MRRESRNPEEHGVAHGIFVSVAITLWSAAPMTASLEQVLTGSTVGGHYR